MKVEGIPFRHIDLSIVREIEGMNLSKLYKFANLLHLKVGEGFGRKDLLQIISSKRQNILRKALKEIESES